MVTVANIEADNGVVHVINAVLIPEDDSSINESNLNSFMDKYLYTIDLLGNKVNKNAYKLTFDIYESGKIIKKLKI